MEGDYVLITPARNEAATIDMTIRSVLGQTVRPKEWVVVSDRSSDLTDEIVNRYASEHPFIHFVRIDGHGEHSFASVVRATETGIRALRYRDYSYLGLVDADVRFPPDYFERLIGEFGRDPRLGIAGGFVWDVVDGMTRNVYQNLNEVAGATQFFKRECFESLGGLLAIPEGGWDAITCVQARMNGFKTVTFPELIVEHLKTRNLAHGNLLRRTWQLGVRDYVLGYHPLFLLAKCCSRCLEYPFVVAALCRLGGYCWAALAGHKPFPQPELVDYLRREQLRRLNTVIHLRPFGR